MSTSDWLLVAIEGLVVIGFIALGVRSGGIGSGSAKPIAPAVAGRQSTTAITAAARAVIRRLTVEWTIRVAPDCRMAGRLSAASVPHILRAVDSWCASRTTRASAPGSP